ncbi:hypothetical protein BEP19_09365 [Ammoniphilus oxalaticus]|uniref:DUF3006 domain-containing protein n=1 Tax=Ammoniphilus oxalaticus TaxID=66863 RepID=A0A419SKR3_9BACL|nr:DUF3006 domain-containing protein [Ammoniphilus oxalaticus]RKD24575.1 hypothetical protein BEP19_09365 [Ammoniphilus oxalaticus]
MKEAVVDRIVDGKHLVLLIGDEEKECVVPLSKMTEQLKEGDWVTLSFDANDEIVDITSNPAKTSQKQDSIQAKMAKLRAKKGSRFQSD